MAILIKNNDNGWYAEKCEDSNNEQNVIKCDNLEELIKKISPNTKNDYSDDPKKENHHKPSLKVKDLKWLLNSLDDDADIIVSTQYKDTILLLDVLKGSTRGGLHLTLEDIEDPIDSDEIEELQKKQDLLEKIGYVIDEYHQNPRGLYQDIVKRQKKHDTIKRSVSKRSF